MKFIIYLWVSTLGYSQTIQDIIDCLPEARVWIAMSAGNEDTDPHRIMLTQAIDQGQVPSKASRNYLAWALKTYAPVKLEKNAITELEKIKTNIPNLIGYINIKPEGKSFSFMISKQSNLDVVSVVKLTEIAPDERNESISLKSTKPEEYEEMELGTFYWPNAERIILEIAAREYTAVSGKEAYDRSRASAWEQFIPEDIKPADIPKP